MNKRIILQKAMEIAEEAGKKIMSYYGHDFKTEYKDENSPLTEADLASNQLIVSSLKDMGFVVLSEEEVDDDERLCSDKVWVVDPMDGTKDFINQTGEFTVMMALVERGDDGNFRPSIALIYQPAKRIFYYALKNKGSYKMKDGSLNRLRVSRESDWPKVVMLSSHNHSTELEQRIAKEYGVGKVKNYGSSLKACLIAEKEGHFNCNPAPFTWEWDVCASDLIIREAGGKFSDKLGNEIVYNKKDPRNHQGYLASNGVLHSKLIAAIKKHSN